MSSIIRLAFRSLSRTPGVSAVVVATLAIGIALVTGMITLLNGWAWASLPYEDADRIVAVGVQGRSTGLGSVPADVIQQVRAMDNVFGQVAAYSFSEQSLRIGDAAVLAETIAADNELFALLRVAPAKGRIYTAQDGDAVAVLSRAGWHKHFADDPQVIGRTVYTDGVARTIIGVLPENFAFENGDLYVPLHLGQGDYASVLGRLADGVTAATARTRVEALRLPIEPGEKDPGRMTINEDMTQRDPLSHAGAILLMFVVATAFVLLIACANVVSIMLARGVARRPQYAIRAALGAGRKRLFLENIAESVVLAVIATVIGVFLASWAISIFVAMLGQGFPSWLRFPIDMHIVAAAGLIALFVILFIGWMPAWEAGRSGPISLLNSVTVTRSIRESRIGRWVVAAEIALSAALFIGTVLLLRSFTAASNLRVRYDDANVAVARVILDESRFHNVADVDAYIARADRSLAASASRRHALLGEFGGYRSVIGDTMPGAGDWRQLIVGGHDRRTNYMNVVDGEYFKLLGLRILAGRAFTTADVRTSMPVAVVSSALAVYLWA
jgi:putative ABC transport system permease protein